MLSTVAGTSALKTFYLHNAESILGSLSASYLGPASGESVLFDGYPGGLNGKNIALIYSDYYFTEALLRLQNVLDGRPGWLLYSPAAGRAAAAVAVAPEPSTWGLMLLGFGALGVMGYRRRGREARHTKAAA